MKMFFKRDRASKRSGNGSGRAWMPREPAPHGLSADQERQAEYDDLQELLAATNAKRAARGKQALSHEDVQMRNWETQQQMRRHGERGEDPDTGSGR